ncbi:hypothetical protein B0T12DRAFT_427326 [Alternaria alternata]|nr:hypothetical protein B0T12DRAFT_427326 [Alternaria alternata]
MAIRVSLSDMLAAALLFWRLLVWIACESQTVKKLAAKQCVRGLGESHCCRGALGVWRRRMKEVSLTTAQSRKKQRERSVDTDVVGL